MNIITGATGLTHVTSNNDGEFNQAIFGDSLVVLKNGNKLDAEITTNNLITVKDGDLVFQGRHALIEPGTTDAITISTGTVDMKRNDLIVARYKLDPSTGYESLTLAVIEGTETSGTASDPSYTTGVIRTGATLAEFPLYRVKIDGINITDLEKLFTPIENIIDGSSADKISYDNTESGIEATNVQDAIDECNENLTKFGKLLYSGSFSSGSITIDGSYTCYAMELCGTILCLGNANFGGIPIVTWKNLSTNNSWAYRLASSKSGNQLTLTIDVENKGGSDGSSNQPITKIYGVF